MRSIVILGGPTELFPTDLFLNLNKQKKDPNQKIIGVDHGNLILLNHGIIPDVAVGDYDSLNEHEKKELIQNIHDIRFAQPEKDFTDSEFGLQVALEDFNSEKIKIYGATGGRIDHFLVNLFTFMKPGLKKFATKFELIDRQNIIKFYNPGSYEIQRVSGYKYLAFVNLMETKNLIIKNAKYELYNYNARFPISWSSNEFVKDTVNFSFDTGFLAVIYSKDLDK